jgi:hypothetical protein
MGFEILVGSADLPAGEDPNAADARESLGRARRLERRRYFDRALVKYGWSIVWAYGFIHPTLRGDGR